MKHTCPGPMIVPFQYIIMISSLSSNPYEQDPSPMPFSPFSSSSRRRKFRGTGISFSQCLRSRHANIITFSHGSEMSLYMNRRSVTSDTKIQWRSGFESQIWETALPPRSWSSLFLSLLAQLPQHDTDDDCNVQRQSTKPLR